jgi:hypothetical protein
MLLYRFLEAEYALKSVRERRLKISRLDCLNDPFEFLGVNLRNRGVREVIKSTKSDLAKRFGILCFSKSWQNPLLWSHYADKHKGLCLGFEVPDDRVREVRYVPKRLPCPSLQEWDEDFVQKLLYTKFKHWEYEQEYRVWVALNGDEENGHYFFKYENIFPLREVMVGAESAVTRSELFEALGDMRWSVTAFKARPAFGEFRVVRNKNKSLWK